MPFSRFDFRKLHYSLEYRICCDCGIIGTLYALMTLRLTDLEKKKKYKVSSKSVYQ